MQSIFDEAEVKLPSDEETPCVLTKEQTELHKWDEKDVVGTFPTHALLMHELLAFLSSAVAQPSAFAVAQSFSTAHRRSPPWPA